MIDVFRHPSSSNLLTNISTRLTSLANNHSVKSRTGLSTIIHVSRHASTYSNCCKLQLLFLQLHLDCLLSNWDYIKYSLPCNLSWNIHFPVLVSILNTNTRRQFQIVKSIISLLLTRIKHFYLERIWKTSQFEKRWTNSLQQRQNLCSWCHLKKQTVRKQ